MAWTRARLYAFIETEAKVEENVTESLATPTHERQSFRLEPTAKDALICLLVWIAACFMLDSLFRLGDFQRELTYEEIDSLSNGGNSNGRIERVIAENRTGLFSFQNSKGLYLKLKGEPIERRISIQTAEMLRTKGFGLVASDSASPALAFYASGAFSAALFAILKLARKAKA